MEIRSLENIDFDTLFESFSNAFSDYEIHFDKSEVKSMLTRRGYMPHLSFAAFDEARIVAFTFNGIGLFGGIPTAYYCVFDRNTGDLTQIAVKKEYRRKGIASLLLGEAVRQMDTDFIKVINVPSDGHSLSGFLKNKNIRLVSKQFEMVRSI